MVEDENVLLILGRPFLATSCALINVECRELTLRIEDDKVQLSIYQNDKLQKKANEGCMRVEAIPMHGDRRQPNQEPMILTSACIGTLNQKPMIHSPGLVQALFI